MLAVILIVAAFVVLAVPIWIARRARRRAAQARQPFPAAWRELLQRSLPLYRRMPADLRHKLEPAVRTFLNDVRFVGCQGLEVTDEMRLVIATQACLLVVERDRRVFESLGSVLIYPDKFVVTETDEDEAGVVTEGESVLSGQSFDTSRIVLSWQDVLESGRDGEVYNVVLHEFAHYLDNTVDGALSDTAAKRDSLEAWHALLQREYEALCDALERGEETLIDPYGAEHPAEFLAVATETFFEEPVELRRRHAALYAELKSFYGLDPASW